MTQHIPQGEGGEQGDPLMPTLFSLGQHPALEAAQRRLRDKAKLFAHLEDVVFVCRPNRVAEVEAVPEPNGPKFGWQHRANMWLEEQRFASHWAELPQLVKALWRSQRRGRWRWSRQPSEFVGWPKRVLILCHPSSKAE